MTCIVGIERDGVVFLGGDSAGVDLKTLDIDTRVDEKVFRNEEFVIGFTSSFRMGQLLRYVFSPPVHDPKKDDMTYLVTDFVDALRFLYKDKGYSGHVDEEDENNKSDVGGTFIFGYHGKLYSIDDDFHIVKTTDGFMAIGCGQPFALGSLMSTKHVTDPLERLNIALTTAAHFNAGVRGPFKFISTLEEGYLVYPSHA